MLQHWHAKQSPGAQTHKHQDVKHSPPLYLLIRTYINIYCYFTPLPEPEPHSSPHAYGWMFPEEPDAHVSENLKANYGHII